MKKIVLVIFLTAQVLVGQSGQWITLDDFSGGLNLNQLPAGLQPNEALILRNAVISGNMLEKRRSFTQMGSKFATDPVRAITGYTNGSTQKEYVVAIAGNGGYVSEDGGYTFNMFFHTSGVTVTNGSKTVLFSDSGFVRRYRDMYFSGWVIKLPNGIYSVERFAMSINTAVDTVFLEIPYSGTTAADTCHYELSPFIGGDYVDFTEWHHKLFIADGYGPIKVWDGTNFRSQDTITITEDTVSSFRIDSVHTEACEYGIRWLFYIDQSYSHPTDDQIQQYGFGNYRIDWSDNDSVGIGDNFLYSKPTPMAYGWGSPLHYVAVEGILDTAFGDLNGGVPRNVRKDSVVYIYDPSGWSDYSIVDSGSFEAITKIDSTASLYSPYPIVQRLYDFTDSQKTWSSTEHNYNATYLTFVRPDSSGWQRYAFRCVNRVSSPAGTALRVQMTVNPRSVAYHNKWVADYATLPQRYWIVKDVGVITNSENMPSAAFVREQTDVLWCAGFSDAPGQVWVSDPGSDSLFGTLMFDVHGGGDITSVFPIYNYMIFATNKSIVQVQGNDAQSFGQTPLVYEFGLKSSRSMFQWHSGFLGYNDEGIFFFDGSQPKVITDKIFSIFRDSVNRAATDKIAGTSFLDRLYVGVPVASSTVNNRTYYFDTQSNAWVEWTGIRASSFLRNINVSSGDSLIYADADSAALYVYGRDYGSDFAFEYVSPFLSSEQPALEQNVARYVISAGFDDSLQVSFYTNYNLTAPVEVDTLLSSGTANRFTTYLNDCTGKVRGYNFAIGLKSLSSDTVRLGRIDLNVLPCREIRQ